MSLSVRTRPGTATHPLGFALHYEFVDARQQGAALQRGGAVPEQCARLVTAPGALVSPRNALWFGRGGARRLRCVYRLQAAGARLELALAAAAFGLEPRCATRTDPLTGRAACVPDAPEPGEGEGPGPGPGPGGDGDEPRVPHLWIYESPWAGYRVPLACVCDNASAPLVARGHGALELELVAPVLRAREDQRHLQYRGAWSSAPAPPCASRRRLPPPGAHLHLVFPYE